MTRDFENVAAAFLLRWLVGILLLFAGLSKLATGYTASVDMITSMFLATWIPQTLVSGIAYALPIVEVLLGALLLIGIFSDKLLLCAGLLFILFSAGTLVAGKMDLVAYNSIYLLITCFGLYLHGYDDWRFGW